MAAEWYYLDGLTEAGPINGSQLRKLADAGFIFPSTPVKRAVGDDISPWTRAGAIQGIFSGDVTHQLGDPICDDCGRRLENGICSACRPKPAVITPPASDSFPAFDQRKRYRNLRFYCGLLQAAGWVFLLVGIASTIVGAIELYSVSDIPFSSSQKLRQLIMAGLPTIIGAGLYLVLHAASESILVVVDIEENTRRTAYFAEHKH